MENCLFCKIANKDIDASIIDETDKSIAFLDNNPVSDGHILVIPKKHFINLTECQDEYLSDLILLTKKISRKIYESKLNNWGINYLSNQESIAGQKIFHFHMHIIPKYAKNEGLIFSVKKKKVNDINKIKKYLNN
ncbi:MAG: HIT family protein [Mycoplasmoidaceae bacterium]